ncbi:hypothetical protein J4Q44_G00373950 [Coregonus suidteri]|uniref:Uncharacterized protein n=1 Tax=Coregonus suidteri TaxID=861788 RepID=A0AAN8KS06_9TELE
MKEEEEEEEDDEEDDSGTTVKDSEEETVIVKEDEEEEDAKDAKAKETEPQHQKKQAWVPTTYSKFGKEVFCYVGQEISIFEALDSYGAVIWPAVSAWVTATDLPEILGNLRANLLRNTRGRCRFTPQAAALSWGPDVERIYPRSVYRYDYVLAADVVYHHDYLEELLFTMRYFCRPGTTLIWANKVRLETDLRFTEDFQNTFNTTLLAEIGQVNIFMATCRETEVEPELVRGIQQEEEELEEEEEEERVTECVQEEENGLEEEEEVVEAVETTEKEVEDETKEEGPKEDEENQEDSEEYRDVEEQHISTDPRSTSQSELEGLEELDTKETKDTGDVQQDNSHVPWLRLDREVYFYAGHKIHIVEALDSYGGVIWPAALALCNYLETNTDVIDLKGKQVLELGSGTGLVSIIASLLGAQVTATDLPDVLSNLRYNLLRNTRGRSKYTPEVTALAWGPGVERTYPRSIYHYDYVLAADVVYHHDLEELLFTMRYFCRPGTTLIWANKVRLKTNLGFTEDFKNTFHTTLLAEMGEVKIFKATCKR